MYPNKKSDYLSLVFPGQSFRLSDLPELWLVSPEYPDIGGLQLHSWLSGPPQIALSGQELLNVAKALQLF